MNLLQKRSVTVIEVKGLLIIVVMVRFARHDKI